MVDTGPSKGVQTWTRFGHVGQRPEANVPRRAEWAAYPPPSDRGLGPSLAQPTGRLEIAQNALKTLLVDVALFPAPEVTDVAPVAQLDRPGLARVHHRAQRASVVQKRLGR